MLDAISQMQSAYYLSRKERQQSVIENGDKNQKE